MQEYIVNLVNPNDWQDTKYALLFQSDEQFKGAAHLSTETKMRLKQIILGEPEELIPKPEQLDFCTLVDEESVIIILESQPKEPVFTPPNKQQSVTLQALPASLNVPGSLQLENPAEEELGASLSLGELLQKRDDAFDFIFKVDEIIAVQLDERITALNDQMQKISHSIGQLENVKTRLLPGNMEQFRLQESDTHLEEELNDINEVMNDLLFTPST